MESKKPIRLVPRFEQSDISLCGYCGNHYLNRNIMHHIREKHGEGALEDFMAKELKEYSKTHERDKS